MSDEKISMNNDELNNVGAGIGENNGWWLSVSASKSYLPLKQKPSCDCLEEVDQIPNGARVWTNGTITNGSSSDGDSCQFRWVLFNGQWGWADADSLS